MDYPSTLFGTYWAIVKSGQFMKSILNLNLSAILGSRIPLLNLRVEAANIEALIVNLDGLIQGLCN